MTMKLSEHRFLLRRIAAASATALLLLINERLWRRRVFAACTPYAVRLDERAPTPFVEQGSPVELEVVIFKPEGAGPFPTLMFNHGSTGNGSDPSLFGVTVISEDVAKFFLQHRAQPRELRCLYSRRRTRDLQRVYPSTGS